MVRDKRGLALTAAGDDAADAYDAVVDEYLAFGRNAGALVKEALARDGAMPMVHVLRGYFFLLMGKGGLKARAARAAEDAAAGAGTARERCHAEALGRWAAGDTAGAVGILEDVLLEHPLDIVALRIAHFLHFYHGAIPQHRDSLARVMPAWDGNVPGYGYVLGMRAFGLEEAGEYREAERLGRQAVDIDPSDAWSVHAVAHVMEMEGRPHEGIDWVRRNESAWEGKVHNFANHLWWHQALFHLALGETDAVLDLYDGRFRADTGSDEYLDLVNATSMLLRLDFGGVDVGGRWTELAGHCRPLIADRIFPFVDAHYMMAHAMTGDGATAAAHLEDMSSRSGVGAGTADRVYVEVGGPLCEAIAAYGSGDWERCFERLEPVRYDLFRLGGSHAQRDVFHQLLIAAGKRAGRDREVGALIAERSALKPGPHEAWMR